MFIATPLKIYYGSSEAECCCCTDIALRWSAVPGAGRRL